MKKAQSELVGFGIIVVIISIIILIVLISAYNNSKNQNEVSSLETDSFINSVIQYTTDCVKRGSHLDILDIIDECKDEPECHSEEECNEVYVCENNQSSCLILNEALDSLIENSWDTSNGSLVKGYDFAIVVNSGLQGQETLYSKSEGEITNLIKGSKGEYGQNGKQVFFTVYY